MSEGAVPVPQAAVPASHAEPTSLHLAFREERFFLMLAVFIGIYSGLAVVCFRIAIDWTRLVLLGPVPQVSPLRLILAPVLVSVVVAVLVLHVFPAVRG